jgi:hypothetical protein
MKKQTTCPECGDIVDYDKTYGKYWCLRCKNFYEPEQAKAALGKGGIELRSMIEQADLASVPTFQAPTGMPMPEPEADQALVRDHQVIATSRVQMASREIASNAEAQIEAEKQISRQEQIDKNVAKAAKTLDEGAMPECPNCWYKLMRRPENPSLLFCKQCGQVSDYQTARANELARIKGMAEKAAQREMSGKVDMRELDKEGTMVDHTKKCPECGYNLVPRPNGLWCSWCSKLIP